MFVSFLLPFHAKNLVAPYLWVLYKQISHFTPEEIIFIGSEDYFRDPQFFVDENRWDVSLLAQDYAEYFVPSFDELAKYQKIIIPSTLFADLEETGVANEEIVRRLLTERFAQLEAELSTVFAELVQQRQPDAVLTWCNVPSLTAVAASLGLPIIHNELGPLRKPCYHDTAFFDFRGVNGNTEAKSRFERFCAEGGEGRVPILSRRELLELFLVEPSRAIGGNPEFEVGIPLQVENDTNMIAFANGWDNQRLIEAASAWYGREQSLIRRHPGGLVNYPDTHGVLDTSVDSIEFLSKCRRIVTINSSVGLEAMLFNLETTILGDNPAAFVAANMLGSHAELLESERQLVALNFLLFGYLIPFEYLYDPSYFRWRLTSPSEVEIYDTNLTYLLKRQKYLNQGCCFRNDNMSLQDVGLLKFGIRQFFEHRRQARRIAELENANRKLETMMGTVISELQQNINALTHTVSWRITSPLRTVGKVLRWRKVK